MLAAAAMSWLLVACGSTSGATHPAVTPRAYLDQAIGTIRRVAVYVPAGGWPAVIAHAQEMIVGVTSLGGTYPAIEYVIGQLNNAGDEHALFLNSFSAKLFFGSANAGRTIPPTVSLVTPRIGLIALPSITSAPNSSDARNYERQALNRISHLEISRRPCGWIVDLRDDPGGDDVPMLLSVGPIVGSGRVLGFRNDRGLTSYVSYRNGVLAGAGETSRSPLFISNFMPAPPVAILIGSSTISAGEAVAIAFRGRPNTRSFGEVTSGATGSPQSYDMPDGAVIRVSVARDVDRFGNTYDLGVVPDVSISFAAGSGAVVEAANKWLSSTAACRRTSP